MMPALRNVRRSRRLSKLPPRTDLDNSHYSRDDEQLLPPMSKLPARPTRNVFDNTVSKPIDPASSPISSPSDSSSTHHPSSRKKRDGHIRRPPNAFMCFRSDLWAREKHKSDVERDHRMISRIAGQCWNRLSEKERAPFKRQAELAKRRHAEIYPEYKYAPAYRKEEAKKRRLNRSTEKDRGRFKEIDEVPLRDGGTQKSPSAAQFPLDGLMESSRSFVPTDEVPPLDLNGPAETVRVQKSQERYIPPECDPNFVESRFSHYYSGPTQSPISRPSTPTLATLYDTVDFDTIGVVVSPTPPLGSPLVEFTDPFVTASDHILWTEETRNFDKAQSVPRVEEMISPLGIPGLDSAEVDIYDWLHRDETV